MNDFLKLLTTLPLWGILLITFIAILLSFKCGELLGKRHRSQGKKEDSGPIGSIVGATLGLLAFLLAFTFGIASARFDERRTLVINEANAIGTTYLRAGYLPLASEREIRALLKKYLAVRLEALTPEHIVQGVKESLDLQHQLWQQAVEVAHQNFDSDLVALFVQSLNEVFDLHRKRVNAGIYLRIPFVIWVMLYVVTFLSMGTLGYQCGLVHTHYIGVSILLMLTFSCVLLLIIDLDHPQEGFINVSQQALIDLKHTLETIPSSKDF